MKVVRTGSTMTPHSIVRIFSFALLAGALGIGCSDAATPTEVAPPLVLQDGIPVRDASAIQTDSTVYRLVRLPGEYRTYVTATYRNTTGGAVHYARCGTNSTGPMFGVVRTGPDSTRLYMQDIAWACVGGVPMGTIANGESVTIRVPVGSSDQPRMQPALKPDDLVGLLRVYFGLCKAKAPDSDSCDALPAAQRQSNAFLVTY